MMPTCQGNYQVVFVVDLSTVAASKRQSRCERVSCVRAGALKLLTFFASKIPRGSLSKHLRWGCKFYRSGDSGIFIEKLSFGEFNLKRFEEFETKLETLVASECERQKAVASQQLGDNNSFAPVSGQAKKQLQRALTDVATGEFPWDCPLVSSPVRPVGGRGRKKKQTHVPEEPQTHNIAILFTRCPQCDSDWQAYSGDRHSQRNDLLNAILPAKLYSMFFEKCRIGLFWVDVIDYALASPGDVQFVQSINTALQAVDGGLIPMGCLLQLGSPASTFTTSLLSRSTDASSPSLVEPTEKQSCPGDITNNDTEARDVRTGQKADARSVCAELVLPPSRFLEFYTKQHLQPAVHQQMLAGSLHIQDKLEKKILLRPLHFRHGPANKCPVAEQAESTTELSLYVSALAEPTASYSTAASTTTQLTDMKCTQLVVSGNRSLTTAPTVKLQCTGTVAMNSLPLHCLQSELVYIITEESKENVSNTTAASGNVHMQHLLSYMSRNQIALVVDYTDSTTQVVLTGIMQPLTSVSASLTLLRSEMAFLISKQAVFSDLETHSTSIGSLETFIRDSVTHFMQDFKSMVSKTPSVIANSSGDGKETVNSRAEVFQPSLLESWVPAGCLSRSTEQFSSIITSSEDKDSSEAEVLMMKQLRNLYRKQKSVRHTDRHPTSAATSAPPGEQVLRRSPRKHGQASPQKSPQKEPTRKSPRKSVKPGAKGHSRGFTAPVSSRCAYIMKISKEVAAQQREDPATTSADKQAKGGRKMAPQDSAAELPAHSGEFENEAELVEHLKSCYNHVVEGQGSALTYAPMLVSVAICYLKSTHAKDPIKATQDLFQEHILLSNNLVREKNQSLEGQYGTDIKVREYQLQILVRFELQSLMLMEAPSDEAMEPTVQEVVMMLRSLSFLQDTGFLTEYLTEVLLANYVDSVSRFLYLIYEELLQPLPTKLAAMASPENIDSVSVASSVMPPSNASSTRSMYSDFGSEPSRSTRSRKPVTKFSSFSIGLQRQISIPGKAAKSKGKNKEQKMVTRSASKKMKAVSSSKDTGGKSEVRQVRRNLFSPSNLGGQREPLERRQSVATMETIKATPSTPKRTPQKRPQRSVCTPKAYHTLKSKFVMDTPVHKQKSNVTWRRQESKRRRTHTVSEVMVIGESPDKMTRTTSNDKCASEDSRKSFQRGASLGICRRKSFYNAEKKSRNVEKCEEEQKQRRDSLFDSFSSEASKTESKQDRYALLEARMAGGQGTSTPFMSTQNPDATPRRVNTTQLSLVFSQLRSPSPNKTPCKSTPGSARCNIASKFDDTPSKNTRRQFLLSPEKVLYHENLSPRKRAQFEATFKSPGRTARASQIGILSGSSTPSKDGFSDASLVRSRSRAMRRITMETPEKDAFSRCLVEQSPQFGPLSSSRLASRRITPSVVSSPPRHSPQVSKALFMSPEKSESNLQESWSKNVTDQGYAINLLQSPRRVTRSCDQKTVSLSDVQSNIVGVNSQISMTDVSNTLAKDTVQERSLPSGGTQAVVQQLTVGPNVLCRNTVNLSQGSMQDNQPDSICTKSSDSNQSTSTENSFENEDPTKTPTQQNKKLLKTPDSFSKWPRRKRRPLVQSPPAVISGHGSKSSDTRTTPSGDDHQDIIGSRTSDVSKLGVDYLSPGLKRKVSQKSSSCQKNVDRVCPVVDTKEVVQSSGSSCLSAASTPSKRKRSPGVVRKHANRLFGTPLKRRKVSDFENRIDGNTDYFSSDEVFLSSTQESSRAASTVSSSPVFNSQLSGVYPSSPLVEAGDSSGVVLPAVHQFERMVSHQSGSTGDMPSSPVFPSHLSGQQENRVPSFGASESSDHETIPSSPIFARHINSIIDRLGSDESSQRKSPLVKGGTPHSGKKYSPVGARGLVQLMTSPLIANKKTTTDPAQVTSADGSQQPVKRAATRSRRSLYRTESLPRH